MAETKEDLDILDSEESEPKSILKKKITRSRTAEHIEKSKEALKKAHLAKMEQSLPLAQAKADLAAEKARKKQIALEEKMEKMKTKKKEIMKDSTPEPDETPEPIKLKEDRVPSRVIIPKKGKVKKIYMEEETDSEDSSGDEVIFVAPPKKKQSIVKQKAPAVAKEPAPPAPPKVVFKFV
jgi:septal ring factor EnvC (AmiA/AmiB activator)